jgi:hypothetical protein
VRETITKLTALLDRADKSPDEKDESDWEAEDEARRLAGDLFRVHDFRLEGDLKVRVRECGSAGFEDTPRSLYRLLYIFSAQAREKRRSFLVDFEDMYKSCSLFAIVSPDGHFVADPQFYKYRLCLQCRASKQHVEGQEHGVLCGVPGHDNGVRMASPLLRDWWALLLRLLNRQWRVYGEVEI